MVKMLDSNIVANEFELLQCYNVHFRTTNLGKDMNSPVPSVICKIVPLQSFFMDGFGIRLPTNVDMPSNKETKFLE